jgi:hypothetical protein
MLADALAFFLESADALVDFVEAFLRARFAEAVGDVLEPRLEAFAEPLIDALFFLLALLGMAVSRRFSLERPLLALGLAAAVPSK